jgi:hypothetical protein
MNAIKNLEQMALDVELPRTASAVSPLTAAGSALDRISAGECSCGNCGGDCGCGGDSDPDELPNPWSDPNVRATWGVITEAIPEAAPIPTFAFTTQQTHLLDELSMGFFGIGILDYVGAMMTGFSTALSHGVITTGQYNWGMETYSNLQNALNNPF